MRKIRILLAAVTAVCLITVNVFAESRLIQGETADPAETKTISAEAAEYAEETDFAGDEAQGSALSGLTAAMAGKGQCGDKLYWSLSSKGVLTISGSGSMWNYSMYYTPGWHGALYRTDIKSIVIKKGVTSIGSYAFYGVVNAKSVSMPASLKSIGEDAFYMCTSLTSVTIPAGVKKIGLRPFECCSSLKNIYVASANTVYASHSGVLFNKGLTEVICCPEARGSLTFPSGVKRIADWAFFQNRALVSVGLPEGITYIGAKAFQWCPKLASLVIPSTCTTLGAYSFAYCNSLKSVFIPKNADNYTGYAFQGCEGLISMSFEDGRTTIDDSFAAGCSNLKYLYIPGSVTHIKNYAFNDCSSLREIYFGGTEEDWNLNMIYGNDNWPFLSMANVDYNRGAIPMRGLYAKLNQTSFKYDGKAKRPGLTIMNHTYILQEGYDYTVTYLNNVDPGTATVLVNGMRTFTGTLKFTFKITGKKPQAAKKTTLTVSAKGLKNNAVTLKKGKSLKLKVKTNAGKVTYKSNKPKIATVNKSGTIKAKKKGTATVSVKAGNKTVKIKVKVK